MATMRSSILASLLTTLSLVSAQNDLASSKRGLIYVAPEKDANDNNIWTSGNSDLTWYYNYGPSPTAAFANTKLQFVPMLFGANVSTIDSTAFYDTVKGLVDGGTNISYVLAFNEPDGCSNGGSCVDATTAAAVWIKQIEPLKKLGIQLGAPAVTGAPSGFTWLQNFFTQCAGQCSPDFIPVHWYGDFQGLASHLGQVNGTYQNMTTWVTEYNLPDGTLADTQSFFNESSSYFERIDYITHYSLFGSFRSDVSNVGPNAAMLTASGKLTDIGAWYLGEAATGNVPTGGSKSSAPPSTAKFAGWAFAVVASAFFCLA